MTNLSLRLLGGCRVQLHESVLLVGETGIGKTRVVHHLAEMLGHTLVVQVCSPLYLFLAFDAVVCVRLCHCRI